MSKTRHMRRSGAHKEDTTKGSMEVPSSSRSNKRGNAGLIRDLLILALLVAGMVFLAWPSLMNYQARSEMDEQIQTVTDLQNSSDRSEEQTQQLSAALGYLDQYNQDVREGTVSQINDPWGFDTGQDSFLSGLSDGLIGEIRIPTMDTDLPLYLGSTTKNMSKGATVMYGSSAPLGQMDSNCVIAAHRGSSSDGGYMFNYIERLTVGDHIYVSTPWAVLDYQVTSFKVVTPEDTDSVKVQQGRDMITLLTCHPQPQHTYRLLVYCDRVGTISVETPVEPEGTVVPTTADEITIMGMNVPDLQDRITKIALLGGGLLIVMISVRIIRRLYRK